MTAKKRNASGPHRVVNKRKIPEYACWTDEDGQEQRARIPIVTIHDVHYYEGDVITKIDDSAQVLVDRGFLVPVNDGGGKEVDNDGEG